ncbi:dihydrofolate reductase family protein [Streptomyces sp. NBC_01353]|uniref:dihydrofolate reductase family protein n=1 Tax=Streptomyces sp. NBC_01353 TaxID=2903835 RepID=UPI002E330F22|nr:dihydrofolate reductase family protein [Streptomyces sp. NBC_01353]
MRLTSSPSISPSQPSRIGAQLLERGLIDEIDLHIAPVLLGDGIRLFDNPGGAPVRLTREHDADPNAVLSVRSHPVR